jgi:hypothetical protein
MRAPSYPALMLALAGILLVMAGWRWHEAAAAHPDRITSLSADGPSAVLLVQERDCPDRRAAMVAWLRRIEAEDPARALPIFLGVLGGQAGFLDPMLEALPRLDAGNVSRAARAVLRSGIPGTPALVLLDPEGRVLLTDTFATTGPGPRLALAAMLLPRIAPPDPSDGVHELDGR